MEVLTRSYIWRDVVYRYHMSGLCQAKQQRPNTNLEGLDKGMASVMHIECVMIAFANE